MSDDNYGVSEEKAQSRIPAPVFDYLPPRPKAYNPAIGVIGTGNIAEFHLSAYVAMGYNVVALCDVDIAKATEKRNKHFPKAQVFSKYDELLALDSIEVVDITAHPQHRISIVEAALAAKKHVLSQKPFVLNLKDGERLVQLAKENGVCLAVNQNGRWAPHFRYLTQAVASGLIGRVNTIDFSLQFDQTWIAGNEGFESIKHMILYDFAIHWFDIVTCWMEERKPQKIYASAVKFPDQVYRPAALAHVVVEYADAQVRMNFNAHTTLGEEDSTTIVGTEGTLRSRGPRLTDQTVSLYMKDGFAQPKLKGNWFANGFQGTMGELLSAIEDEREPENSAANNLKSLQLCFAAIQSADTRATVDPSRVTKLQQ